jgi:hypothetical protein
MAYSEEVLQWARERPEADLCRELGIYRRQLHDLLSSGEPDPALILRIGAKMEGIDRSPVS